MDRDNVYMHIIDSKVRRDTIIIDHEARVDRSLVLYIRVVYTSIPVHTSMLTRIDDNPCTTRTIQTDRTYEGSM